MRIVWRPRPKRAKNLDVLGRVGEMIFAANHVRDFHLEVVDHVDEMKNPGTIRTANGHIGMRSGIGEIEIDSPANEIIDNDMLARRTKSQSSLVLENVAVVLKLFEVALVKVRAFALQIRPEIAAHVGAFVPIEAEPSQTSVNCRRCFFDLARFVRVFDAENEFAAVMPREEPVKKCRPRPADVEITGRRRGKTDANVGIHVKINPATDYTDFHRLL